MSNKNVIGSPKLFISSDKTISGIVTGADGWSQTFSLSANNSIAIDLPSIYADPNGTGVFKNGIHIETSDSIWVVAIGYYNGDATFVLPTSSLGKEYIVNTYSDYSSGEQFLVVATQDSTLIEVTPPNSVSYIIHLNKGEIYQRYQEIEFNETNPIRLSGYKVKSLTCAKIAVFAGSPASGLNWSTWNQLYEQMQPVYSLGKEFIAVSTLPMNYSDRENLNHSFYNIVAAENNTTIHINGNVVVLNSGETYRINIYNDLYVKSDKPVSVAQLVGGGKLPGDLVNKDGRDPYMTMVSPVGQEIYDVFVNMKPPYTYPGNFNSYVMIIVKTVNKGNVYIDGQNVDSNKFTTCINNPIYSFAQILLSTDIFKPSHIHCSEGFNAYNFTNFSEEGGYTLGFGYTLPLNEQPPSFSITYSGSTKKYTDFNQIVCSCEPIVLSVDNPFHELIYKWKLTDTTYAYGETISHHYLNGDYQITLYALNKDGCILNQVTMDHLIVDNCDISMTPSGKICTEDTIVLSVNAGSTFLWNTGESTQAIKVSPDKNTLYTVSVDGGIADICDSIIVYVKGSKPIVDFGPAQTICEGNSVTLNATYDQSTYLWQDHSTQSTYTVTKQGTYFVTTTNLCGMDQDTIDIFVIQPPKVELGNDFGICLEQQRELCAIARADAFKWSTGSTDSCITITQPGNYFVSVSNRCFTNIDGLTVTHAVCKDLIFYNLITPNNDHLNDFFEVENIEERDCTLSIFNRWGNKVYEKDHYNNEWNASGLSDGVYYYRLDDHTTKSVFKGWVEVLANTSK